MRCEITDLGASLRADSPMVNPAIPTLEAPFECTVPRTATASTPAAAMLYGHGLLGSYNEAAGSSTEPMRERNFMPCAADWIGMADEDIGNVATILADPSGFPSLADRAQQGFLNFLFLGRALRHPDGLASHAAFRDGDRAIFANDSLVYDGNSQGGIMGGALTALAVDHTKATLGVPGMNYSTLLNRSVDWEGPLLDPSEPGVPSYSSVMYTQFPDKRTRQLVMGIIQMLWDRAEANGYSAHMTADPYPNTPAHQVMLHVAFGDFQVASVAAEVEARTIGARYLPGNLLPGRHWSVDAGFGMDPMTGSHTGSALVYWDSGNLTPPNGNVPPLEEGGDPHEDPRRDPRSADQRSTFFRTGVISDVFSGQPYLLCRPGQSASIPRVASLFDFDWW